MTIAATREQMRFRYLGADHHFRDTGVTIIVHELGESENLAHC